MKASHLVLCPGLAICLSALGVICLVSSGCQSTPDASANLNSRTLRQVIVTDLYASPYTTVSKQEFRSSEQQQFIVRGYGGQAVTLELWESRRGLLSHVSQDISPDRVETRSAGMGWNTRYGAPEVGRRVEQSTRMTDWIVPMTGTLPPGQYEVRIKAGGVVQNSVTFNLR
jgi:hypothetical protein